MCVYSFCYSVLSLARSFVRRSVHLSTLRQSFALHLLNCSYFCNHLPNSFHFISTAFCGPPCYLNNYDLNTVIIVILRYFTVMQNRSRRWIGYKKGNPCFFFFVLFFIISLLMIFSRSCPPCNLNTIWKIVCSVWSGSALFAISLVSLKVRDRLFKASLA